MHIVHFVDNTSMKMMQHVVMTCRGQETCGISAVPHPKSSRSTDVALMLLVCIQVGLRIRLLKVWEAM